MGRGQHVHCNLNIGGNHVLDSNAEPCWDHFPKASGHGYQINCCSAVPYLGTKRFPRGDNFYPVSIFRTIRSCHHNSSGRNELVTRDEQHNSFLRLG